DVRRPSDERPVAKSWPEATSDGSLSLPKRMTRPAAQTSCGSSRSWYWRLPPLLTTFSPLPCPNLRAVASVTESPLTAMIVPDSCVGGAPITIWSPGLNPDAFVNGSVVLPLAAPAAPTFAYSAFGDCAAT